MFFEARNGIFVNAEDVSSVVVFSEFQEDGAEQWFVKMFGYFRLPEQFLAPNGGLVIGPFPSRKEAVQYVLETDEEIFFEAEQNDATSQIKR